MGTKSMFAIRAIEPSDAHAVASLHAASWRSAYRGIISDAFLDADLSANRFAFWQQRLGAHASNSFGLLASEGDVPVGFAFAFPNAEPTWGTLLDNLHVLPELKGRGIGRGLLAAMAKRCCQVAGDEGLFLWVYESNSAARRFYESLGGQRFERRIVAVRGGGEAAEWRFAWPSAADLLEQIG
ncbi:GNAT family N-acetyltransferase [Roseateles oligotrophus]|uniref:GNAT family N-acetyltransferase n=1 Tax=Roseateles oligotrophus TaxID=1769250 RepID=A0ABT2YFA5_9BURK|nr:GNAT family N-acetyltransferase [Roseateles oligotrophus]MCV2368665.1 GNAT family N-acetyltransferase [Roseateles oligotrophus]